MITKKLVIGAAVAGCIGLAAIAQSTTQEETPAEMALKPVKLMLVEEAEATLTRQFFGKVVARKTVDLAFQVAGQIQDFPVIEGTRIEQGALVAQLDLRPFELALEQARLQKEQADRTVDRLEKLKGSTVGQVAIDDAVTSAGLAEIALENAEIALEDATLLAPFDALVASRSVENFTTISAGTPVVRLHDMSEIRVEVDLPEVLVQKAGLAEKVNVLAKFPSSATEYPLEVRELTAETSAIGQTYSATFGMQAPEGLSVLPGSSVTVTATLAQDDGGIIVPASAIAIDTDGSTYVYVFRPTGAAEGSLTKAMVTVEPTDDGEVRVVSGLTPGEEIAVAGVNELNDGMQVRRFAGFGN
ncbi:efflux RND transporter periplasmic adaptor subunit [Tropicimonas sediminicola]|uniref:RND family efflux transporter, MFP subunit n=1 Tax=Tropicimonas sediminicola TaxID=1031541 RepID=A0A239KKZ9_9RHOB|nr:efflux RND transporter periplasmic adaptor subunit [Tropicimonas sediminicola]SNT18841.1 RND family efflux transporter, MFP subunit [Tropicimonas sediminicola]